MSKIPNPPAFPTMIEKQKGFNRVEMETIPGMTLRDYFAAAALTGMTLRGGSQFENKYFAETAFEIADAMLVVRSKINETNK